MDVQQKVIDQIKPLDPEKIILFGSYASGRHKEHSDIDFAVIQKTRPRLGQKAKIYVDLEKSGYNWRVEPDIHFFSQEEFRRRLAKGDLFVSEINAKGKVVYAK